ncbi:MAG TPA: glycosyltransferase family 39 protein [Syntrophorhabdaceae bacterium]|nr:glycosyltransferase family 39 protein [Syntrophorhabdaceae bacterium]
MLEKNQYLVLLTLFLIALCARLYLALAPNVITHDGIMYIENAKLITLGDFKKIKEISFFNLYPFVMIGFQKIFINWELSGRMVSVIFGSLGVIPLFFIARKLISQNIAIMAALFFAINPHIVEYSSDVLREPLFWSLFLFALWTGVEGIISEKRDKWFFLFLSVLFTGLSICVRIEGIIVFFILFIWAAWLYKIGDIKGRVFLLNLLAFFMFMLIVSLPPLYFLKARLGWWEFGLLGDKIFHIITQNEDLETIIKNNIHIMNNAPATVKGFLDISLRHRYIAYAFEVIYKLIKPLNIVFFILALFGVIKRKNMPFIKGEVFFLIWFLIACISCYLYVAKIQYLGTRHGLLMGIPVLMWSGIGFFELAEKIKKGSKAIKILSKPLTFSTIFLFLFIFLFNVSGILTSFREDKIELKKAGIYLKDAGFKEKNIATIPPLSRIIFYAETMPVLIHEGMSDEELKSVFSEKKIEYVLIDKRMFDNYFYKTSSIFNTHYLKKIDIPQFNTFKEYSLELYQFVYSNKG